jgi:four helix bundle protein
MEDKSIRNKLEERLIDFAAKIIGFIEQIIKNPAGNHISGQISRSSISSALNYGEAQSAESRKDFVHKIKIVLKELRETHIALRIIYKTKLVNSFQELDILINECNELISIFVKSVETAENNLNKKVSFKEN